MLSAELDFFYGFEATVSFASHLCSPWTNSLPKIPADSYIYLDVHKLTNSTQQGL